MLKLCLVCFAVIALAIPGMAEIQVDLYPSLPSGQVVGTTVLWVADASDTNPGVLDFQFRARFQGEEFRMIRDFHTVAVFDWTPTEHEGDYEVAVTVRNRETEETADAISVFRVNPRGLGIFPAVSGTRNPLIRLYSAPACAAGSYMRAKFTPDQGFPQYTPWKPCSPGRTMNFYLAGMRPNTTYRVNHEVATGRVIREGPNLPFRTDSLPWYIVFSEHNVADFLDSQSCLLESIVLHSNIGPFENKVDQATDVLGRVVWFAPRIIGKGASILRPVAGGTILVTLDDLSIPGDFGQDQLLREMDLLGNVVRETNAARVSEQLEDLGYEPITSFHHDAYRLPNGHTIALASAERILTDIQGPGEVDVIGDMLVDLDENFQVVWAWSSFDHLDLSRLALLGQTCVNGQGGCPPVFLAEVANDWTHSNSVHYVAADGNLILSMRHQDWVIKIDYRNGLGTGEVVWRLGKDGDFGIDSQDPYPWFSHQHDAEFDIPGVPLLTIFDNGNLRHEADEQAQSRGQAFWLDETRMQAIPVLNANLGSYSSAVGSAERLCNGNYSFDSGFINGEKQAQTVEVLPNGQINYVLESNLRTYRTFRMYSMYAP